MARTESDLTPNEILLVQALGNLAVSGATEAIRKSSATTLANVTITGGGTFTNSETPSGLINGSNVTFTIATTPTSGTLRLYRNGLRLQAGASNDYTLSGATITMNQAPESGDVLLADYQT